MKIFDFVRHGKPEDDRGKGRIYSANANLDTEGKTQAEALGREYRRRGVVFDEVYSSPLPRARQTAEQLPRRKKQIRVRRGLAEPHLGELEGMSFADLPSNPNGKGVDLYAIPHEGQEPFSSVALRARREVGRIQKQTKSGKRVAIVSHGLIGKLGMDVTRNPRGRRPRSESELRDEDQLGNAEANSMTVDKTSRVVKEERIKG